MGLARRLRSATKFSDPLARGYLEKRAIRGFVHKTLPPLLRSRLRPIFRRINQIEILQEISPKGPIRIQRPRLFLDDFLFRLQNTRDCRKIGLGSKEQKEWIKSIQICQQLKGGLLITPHGVDMYHRLLITEYERIVRPFAEKVEGRTKKLFTRLNWFKNREYIRFRPIERN